MLSTNNAIKGLSNKNLHELTQNEVEQVQKITFEMMRYLDKYFEKNNLSYYLGGGSALGAYRHRGFIPWDDDLDINMPKKDYQKLIELFQTDETINKYFYLCENSYDSNFDVNFMKIKLKGTKYTEYLYTDYAVDGIFIDVFPVENTYSNLLLRFFHGFLCTFFLFVTSCVRIKNKRKKYLFLSKNFKYVILIYLKIFIGIVFSFYPLDWWLKKTNSILSMCKNNDSKYITVPTGRKHFFGEIHKRADIFPLKKADFETAKFFVANENERYLESLFSNYKEIPKVHKREKHFVCEFYLDINKTSVLIKEMEESI